MTAPEMLTHAEVPFCLNDINKDWLTEALQESGVINDETVVDFSHRIIGTEAGFNGEVAILTLQYSDPQTDAPKSMVLKIPTALKNRILGQTMGLYEKEIRFYRDLKPLLNIRAPSHYYSALDIADDWDVVRERMEGLNKLPMWLIAVLTKGVSWLIGKTPRRYALLIEDLSDYRMGDQMQACSDEDTRRVLCTIASLHGQFWKSEQLATMTWIAPVTLTSKIIQMMFQQSINKFLAANKHQMSDRQLQLIDWLTENGMALTEKLGEEPATLLHGDVRLDNVCFDDANQEALLFDWQTMQSGPAGMDLAYFLSAAVPVDANESRINELIAFYYEQLQAKGVEISLSRLRWQYELGMLGMVHRILPTLHTDQLDLGSDRGPKMMQQWVDKILAKLEHIQFETILDEVPA
jgi:thiamine kinase-like enzyme